MHLSSKAYPSKSPEQRSQIVGIAEHVGHDLTYWVLTNDTVHIISHSELCPVDPLAPNKRADLLSGEEIQPPKTFVKLSTKHKDYNGTSKITTKPLSVIATDNPVICALYARDHDLLDTLGWKRFKKIANRHKKLICQVNQVKLRLYRSVPKYMFGYCIPRKHLS